MAIKKITIVGAGRVGEATAQFLVKNELCRELVLLDAQEGVAQGAALDIQQSAPLFDFDARVTGSTNYELIADSDLVVITAGKPRKPGMSRSDVLDSNLPIITDIMNNVMRFAPQSLVMIVTNPVDVLTYHAWRHCGWDRARVFGQAGVLDSARMASFIAGETGLSVKDISAMVLGGHGDTMLPLIRYTTISGIPLTHFLDQQVIEKIIERTRHGGFEILRLRQTSSAYDAPAAAIAGMVDAIRHNRKRILPCVAILQGEYGENEVAMGVPSVLGGDGLERIVELPLTEEEQEQFKHSVEAIRTDLAHLARA
ncbi:malate dehydrogenase [Nitrosococcus oceani]|uniref:Malate dehydrogenase n=1 Tax=Nitrosococcus oceani (strain ATCC 19707 / BCRC 17464 / JCM 30415 / NCIMB 11848 / C-107) TaxID=323261 RepID=MDH_NITOC|nr:malate dehydrogenase [Nitrosococcus oceani]Q3J7E7.1 RecName: Full=Malate dehydrogenase [Nitrosococcus oceani ATCC 19707]ABA59249.1 malate dehydrogenase (NAD) [Nitrosococcus oceani ATCC 19707]EDZ66448.1 malate dehydrogenase, NAD-dependent [Nitrosococcus oceani AFC27]GEM21074.1 malate dehydrogenase [Nitrosococcus oceani]